MPKAIFENLLLNEETKVQLEEAFSTAIEAKIAILESEYREKEEALQETVVADIQEIVAEALSEELDVLAEELEHARTLDVQYAEKLEMFKESYASSQEDVMQVLVAETVAEEINELREDVEQAKKHAFGVKMFESFRDMYDANFGGVDVDVVEKLREAEMQLETYQRKEKMDELMEGIGGKERNVLATLLEGYETSQLESRFNTVKSIVLRESAEVTAPVLTESAKVEVLETARIVLENTDDNADVLDAFQKALSIATGKKR